MARTNKQQQPRQNKCYICATPFSSDNIHKYDLGSRRAILHMIPGGYKRDHLDGEWFSQQEYDGSFIHVCCLCKGAVKRFFTREERLRHLTSPPMLQWAVKMIGFTQVRTQRDGRARMVHGPELLNTFDAESEACIKFKETWLSTRPQYPARRPFPQCLEEEDRVEPDYEPYDDIDDELEVKSEGSVRNGSEDDEPGSDADEGSDVAEEEVGYSGAEDHAAKDVSEVDSEDDDEDNASTASGDIAAALIPNTPAAAQRPPPREPSPYVRQQDLVNFLRQGALDFNMQQEQERLAQANRMNAFMNRMQAQEERIRELEEQVAESAKAQEKSSTKRREMRERLKTAEDTIQENQTDLLHRIELLEDRIQDLTDEHEKYKLKRKRDDDTPFDVGEGPSSSVSPTARQGQQAHKSISCVLADNEVVGEAQRGNVDEDDLEVPAPPPAKKHKQDHPVNQQIGSSNVRASSSSSSNNKTDSTQQDYIRRTRPRDCEMAHSSRYAETIQRHKAAYAVNHNLRADT